MDVLPCLISIPALPSPPPPMAHGDLRLLSLKPHFAGLRVVRIRPLRLTLLLMRLIRPGLCRRHRRVFERVLAAVEGEPFHRSVLARPLSAEARTSRCPRAQLWVYGTPRPSAAAARESSGKVVAEGRSQECWGTWLLSTGDEHCPSWPVHTALLSASSRAAAAAGKRLEGRGRGKAVCGSQ